jgi:hypothetical protein
VHPDVSAVGSDKITAVHAELQELKSLLQTRTLWLPALHTLGVGASDCAGGIGLPDPSCGVPCPRRPGLRVCAPAAPGETAKKSAINNNMDLVMEAPNACVQVAFPT